MKIHGFNKTTLLDYPEHLAATIFTGGCNFRCPFCHNGGLVLDPDSQPAIPEEEVLKFLQKRRGILQGVCITGGEPTLQPDLENFICKIKELGYLVKLDTNGSRPEVLKALMEQGLLDYVAMDIKASEENYARVAGVRASEPAAEMPAVSEKELIGVSGGIGMAVFTKKPNSLLDKIRASVDLLKNGTVPYEFRTTVVKGLHTAEEFDSIGQWLAGCSAYYLQAYRENENILAYCESVGRSGDAEAPERPEASEDAAASGGIAAERLLCLQLSDFTREEMESFADTARKYISKVELRGVE